MEGVDSVLILATGQQGILWVASAGFFEGS
jgi:hypothetical protein